MRDPEDALSLHSVSPTWWETAGSLWKVPDHVESTKLGDTQSQDITLSDIASHTRTDAV